MPLLSLSFLPEQAAVASKPVDSLFIYLIFISSFFGLLIAAMIIFFSIRYKRKSESDRPKEIHGNNKLEMLWTIIPLIISLTIFGWGLVLYFNNYRPPAHALEVFVVGKQWMWKLQHPSGPREIDELHVPINYPVRLTLTSEDVIHSFYVPAFRIKMDAVPGRYTHTWFQATKVGKYHLFCAEYCGTEHSKMIGWVHVMSQEDYQKWISERTGQTPMLEPGASALSEGEKIFQKYRCFACHHAAAGALGPDLSGIYGKQVKLLDGTTVTADENYLRESIKTPQIKIVEGYAPLMPTFENILSEEQIFAIIEYLKKWNSGTLPQDAEGTQSA